MCLGTSRCVVKSTQKNVSFYEPDEETEKQCITINLFLKTKTCREDDLTAGGQPFDKRLQNLKTVQQLREHKKAFLDVDLGLLEVSRWSTCREDSERATKRRYR